MWKKDYHKTYQNYVLYNRSYERKNSSNFALFDECNRDMLTFARLLNEIDGIEFNDYQLTLTEFILPYVLPMIYHKYWSQHKTNILKLYGYPSDATDIKTNISFTSRRDGKTTWIINTIIALVCSVRTGHGFKFAQALVANNERISLANMALLKDRLKGLPEFRMFENTGQKHKPIMWNAKQICLRRLGDKEGYLLITAYPGGEVSLNTHTFLLTLSQP